MHFSILLDKLNVPLIYTLIYCLLFACLTCFLWGGPPHILTLTFDYNLAWRCQTHNSSQNVSLRPLHWAVIMGRVSTEPGNKMPLRSIG